MVAQYTLLHGEALLVVASRNTEDILIKLLAEGLALDLGADAVVVQRAQLFFSSSTSTHFWAPVDGQAMLSFIFRSRASRTCVDER